MNDKEIMKTLKCNKRDLKVEYIKFCNDMLYDSNNKLVKEDFAKAYIEHNIGAFGFFDNDFFISKDLEKIKQEIILILESEI